MSQEQLPAVADDKPEADIKYSHITPEKLARANKAAAFIQNVITTSAKEGKPLGARQHGFYGVEKSPRNYAIDSLTDENYIAYVEVDEMLNEANNENHYRNIISKAESPESVAKAQVGLDKLNQPWEKQKAS